MHNVDCAKFGFCNMYIDQEKYLVDDFSKLLISLLAFVRPTLIEECAMLPKCARRLATPGKYHDFLRSGIAPRSPYYTKGTQLLESI